jgi:histidinol-phosphate aminotransferase
MIPPRPHIAAMAPYALARMEPPPGRPLISLAQNESLRPPSPAVLDALKAAHPAETYPDPDWTRLRKAIAGVHDLDPALILCGAGSLDLIACLARAYAGPDRAVLAPAHAYPFFHAAAQTAEARFDTAPEEDFTVSVDALLDAVRPDTGLLFLANPGNPTGTRIPASEIRRLRDALREDILLVIDEAYGEFADQADAPLFDLVDRGDTVVLRTFSKAYGLAGVRVGWGAFPPTIAAELRKIMNPNNLPTLSQAAAGAALSDLPYMRATCALIASAGAGAALRLADAGIATRESSTNFLLLDLKTADAARAADAHLRSKGIFLRPQSGAGLPQTLRMTIGPPDHVDLAIDALEGWARETRT